MTSLPKELRALKLDHIGIAVKDLQEASIPYLALGLKPSADEVLAEQFVSLRIFELDGIGLELLQATSPKSPIAKFIQKRGEGLHHIALRVENIEAEYRRLKELQAVFVPGGIQSGHGNSKIVFLHPKWTKGTLLELIEKP